MQTAAAKAFEAKKAARAVAAGGVAVAAPEAAEVSDPSLPWTVIPKRQGEKQYLLNKSYDAFAQAQLKGIEDGAAAEVRSESVSAAIKEMMKGIVAFEMGVVDAATDERLTKAIKASISANTRGIKEIFQNIDVAADLERMSTVYDVYNYAYHINEKMKIAAKKSASAAVKSGIDAISERLGEAEKLVKNLKRGEGETNYTKLLQDMKDSILGRVIGKFTPGKEAEAREKALSAARDSLGKVDLTLEGVAADLDRLDNIYDVYKYALDINKKLVKKKTEFSKESNQGTTIFLDSVMSPYLSEIDSSIASVKKVLANFEQFSKWESPYDFYEYVKKVVLVKQEEDLAKAAVDTSDYVARELALSETRAKIEAVDALSPSFKKHADIALVYDLYKEFLNPEDGGPYKVFLSDDRSKGKRYIRIKVGDDINPGLEIIDKEEYEVRLEEIRAAKAKAVELKAAEAARAAAAEKAAKDREAKAAALEEIFGSLSLDEIRRLSPDQIQVFLSSGVASASDLALSRARSSSGSSTSSIDSESRKILEIAKKEEMRADQLVDIISESRRRADSSESFKSFSELDSAPALAVPVVDDTVVSQQRPSAPASAGMLSSLGGALWGAARSWLPTAFVDYVKPPEEGGRSRSGSSLSDSSSEGGRSRSGSFDEAGSPSPSEELLPSLRELAQGPASSVADAVSGLADVNTQLADMDRKSRIKEFVNQWLYEDKPRSAYEKLQDFSSREIKDVADSLFKGDSVKKSLKEIYRLADEQQSIRDNKDRYRGRSNALSGDELGAELDGLRENLSPPLTPPPSSTLESITRRDSVDSFKSFDDEPEVAVPAPLPHVSVSAIRAVPAPSATMSEYQAGVKWYNDVLENAQRTSRDRDSIVSVLTNAIVDLRKRSDSKYNESHLTAEDRKQIGDLANKIIAGKANTMSSPLSSRSRSDSGRSRSDSESSDDSLDSVDSVDSVDSSASWESLERKSNLARGLADVAMERSKALKAIKGEAKEIVAGIAKVKKRFRKLKAVVKEEFGRVHKNGGGSPASKTKGKGMRSR